MAENKFIMNCERLSKEKINRKLHSKIVAVFGKKAYPSYWKYCIKGNKENPDTSRFYLAAQPNPGAGIGHQIANWVAGYWFARMFGLKFANLSFPDKKWDDFLGFGKDEMRMDKLVKLGWSVRRIPKFEETDCSQVQLVKDIMSAYSGQKIVFLCEQDQFYRDQYGVMDELQYKFYSNPIRKAELLHYEQTHFNIAIHVRRGDIMADPSNPNLAMRYLSNDYFQKVLSQVIEMVKTDKPVHIWFFSQGKPEDYPEFAHFPNLHWCMEMGAQESFLHMVYADLLITSKSSFSYKPALLNRGIKVCPENFWHGYPDSNDWVMVDNHGNVRWKSSSPFMAAF